MAYTQHLFDSLRRGGGGADTTSSSFEATLGTPLARSSRVSSTPMSTLQHSLGFDDMHSLITMQKTQLAQLRTRVESLEEQTTQLRDRARHAESSLEVERRKSSGSGALATANEGLTLEMARLRGDKSKLEEALAGKSAELETAQGALKETRQRLEEARQQSERDRAELAFRLGREAGLASLASAVVGSREDGEEEGEEGEEDVDGEERGPATPARGDATNTSTIPLASRLLTAKRGDLGNSSSTVAASAASSSSSSSSSSAAALTFSSSLSSLYEENYDPGASVASTTALLAKHEQLRQQELGLLALKQQHAQQRLMATTQARQAALMQSYAAAAGFPSFGSGLDFATASLPFASSSQGGYLGGPMPATSLHTPMGAGVGGRGAYGATTAAAATANRAGSAAAASGVGLQQQQQGQQQQQQGQQQQQQQQQQGQQQQGLGGMEGGERGMQHLVMSPNGNLEVCAASLLPTEAGGVPMCIEAAEEPSGGWSVYQCPPYPAKWPLTMAFFAPLVDPGIPIIKHGRAGYPHKRVMWLDISTPSDPVLVWQEGGRDKSKLKDKDHLRLVEILNIRTGRYSPALQRTGKDADAGKYLTFEGEEGTRNLDVEFVSPSAAEFFFKKFHELFQAYVVAQKEKLKGDSITVRIAAIVDGGAPAKASVTSPITSPNPNTATGGGGKPGGGAAAAAAAAAAGAQSRLTGGPNMGRGVSYAPTPYSAMGATPYGSGTPYGGMVGAGGGGLRGYVPTPYPYGVPGMTPGGTPSAAATAAALAAMGRPVSYNSLQGRY